MDRHGHNYVGIREGWGELRETGSQDSFPEEVNLSWTSELCLFLFVHLFFRQTPFHPWYPLKALWNLAVPESSIHQPDISSMPFKYKKCHRRHLGKQKKKVQSPGFKLLLVQLRVNYGLNNSFERLGRLIIIKSDHLKEGLWVQEAEEESNPQLPGKNSLFPQFYCFLINFYWSIDAL